MASIGITRLDDLFDGAAGATPITQSDSGEVVGIVQELLRNHDLRKVPGPRHVIEAAWPGAEFFGQYGEFTKRAVTYFQNNQGLPTQTPPIVDSPTRRRLITKKAPKPSAARAFMTRKLDIADSILCRVVTLISSWEENVREGGFRNWKPQDSEDAPQTGLSYGLIQWTHGSERLAHILTRFNQLSALFNSTFGVDAAGAAAMIAHAQQGDDALLSNGDPIDPLKAGGLKSETQLRPRNEPREMV